MSVHANYDAVNDDSEKKGLSFSLPIHSIEYHPGSRKLKLIVVSSPESNNTASLIWKGVAITTALFGFEEVLVMGSAASIVVFAILVLVFVVALDVLMLLLAADLIVLMLVFVIFLVVLLSICEVVFVFVISFGVALRVVVVSSVVFVVGLVKEC